MGSREWKCKFHPTKSKAVSASAGVINRRILSMTVNKLDYVLMLKTEHVAWEEILKDSHVQFFTNTFPKDHIRQYVVNGTNHIRTEHQHSSHRSLMARSTGGCWFCFIENAVSYAWQAVQTIGEAVAHTIEAVVNVIELLVTGSYDYDNTLSMGYFSWNYDGKSGKAMNGQISFNDNVTCLNCFMHFDLGLNLQLHISDWSLDTVSTYLEGDGSFNVDAEMNVYGTFTANSTILLGTINVDDVCFSIVALPICIKTTVPVNGILEIAATADSQTRVTASSSGHLRYGFLYQPSSWSDGVHWINENTLSQYGSLTNAALNTAVSFTIGLFPVFIITIDHLGGPNIGIKVFLETNAFFAPSNSVCSPNYSGSGFQATVNLGIQASVGGHLQVTIPGDSYPLFSRTWNPVGILSLKWPLYNRCYNLQSMMEHYRSVLAFDWKDEVVQTRFPMISMLQHESAQSNVLFETSSFGGLLQPNSDPSCSNSTTYPTAQLTMQYISMRESWIGSLSWNHQLVAVNGTKYNVLCVAQSAYDDGVDPFTPLPFPNSFQLQEIGSFVNYPYCQESGFIGSGVNGAATLSADYSTLSITYGSQCYPATLTLVRVN